MNLDALTPEVLAELTNAGTVRRAVKDAGVELTWTQTADGAWLAEAALYVRPGGSGPLKELMGSPSFFPFRFALIRADALSEASSRLDVFRLGLDEELLMLRKKNRNE